MRAYTFTKSAGGYLIQVIRGEGELLQFRLVTEPPIKTIKDAAQLLPGRSAKDWENALHQSTTIADMHLKMIQEFLVNESALREFVELLYANPDTAFSQFVTRYQ
jgi:hypothetical protein